MNNPSAVETEGIVMIAGEGERVSVRPQQQLGHPERLASLCLALVAAVGRVRKKTECPKLQRSREILLCV